MKVRIEQLTEDNFSDFEALTSCESGGGCYCSFWHQKISSMQEWDQRKKETPDLNRQIILDKIKTGFHAGVLAYADVELLAWISVGPLTDFYWTWKRVAQLGDDSNTVAGITCFTVAPKFRKQGLQAKILKELIEYGKEMGWSSLEAYPFDTSALEKHKDLVLWPGLANGYIDAGFSRVGSHWLHSSEAERSIFKVGL